ncbi:MAG: SsrA-binding protein SmpB [Chloroflexi bacterium]|nr:SsrA-binding protein SmpB [Chloroflexota bacterium]MYF80418.1 SsrA-binding protein SmpB [Chloroflexota bacterium]MYI05299.1 SsrA-binding protein SmpB [Chloroflexota bacterium]
MAKKQKSRRAAESNGSSENERVIARNRRALHRYEILRSYEAGISLTGSEIKSARMGRVSIQEAYCRPRDGELFLIGAHIARYEPSGPANHEPTRDRRLLLHKREIRQLEQAFAERGLTLVPLRLYLSRGIAKLEIGVGRGRRVHEKRDRIAERDAQRRIEQALRR